jgi:hypothetical protein
MELGLALARPRVNRRGMIVFTSLLWIWKGEAAGRWYFLTVPEEKSVEIRAQAFGNPRGFGSVKVEVCIRGVVWRTSVFPLNAGGYLLPIKKEVRNRANIAVGDEVTVTLNLL